MPKRGTEKSGEREKPGLEFNRRDIGAASKRAQSVEIAGQARNDTSCDRSAAAVTRTAHDARTADNANTAKAVKRPLPAVAVKEPADSTGANKRGQSARSTSSNKRAQSVEIAGQARNDTALGGGGNSGSRTATTASRRTTARNSGTAAATTASRPATTRNPRRPSQRPTPPTAAPPTSATARRRRRPPTATAHRRPHRPPTAPTTATAATTARRRRRPLLLFSLLLAMVLALAAGGTAVWAYSYNNSHDLSWYLNSPDAAEFTISTNGQLHAFSALVNGDAINPADPTGPPLPAQSFAGKTVRMSSGLNLFDVEFTPIGTEQHPFAGTFVGKSIQKLKISSPASLQNVGLFGYTSATAQIQGVQLTQNCNITLATSSAAVKINNVGGIVGNNNGSISDCSSAAKLTIAHNAVDISVADGNDGKPVVNNIGGLVGNSTGSIANVSHSGKLELSTPANSYNSPGNLSSFNLYVIENIGGVVGYTSADITGCQNSGSLYAATTGKGATDRFNVAAYSRSHHVGGIAGTSIANISFCSNSGNIFTTGDPAEPGNPQADFDQLGNEPTNSTVRTSPGGGVGIAGIVGNFRHLVHSSEIAQNLIDDGMLPGAPTITVSDCSNTGFINGCHVVGGVVGGAGSKTVVTRCSNGVAGQPDTGTVRSTRWNKPCTGGIVSQSTGIVSYSRNHSLVINTNIGHYNGGVAGLLAQYDLQPFKAELYGCYSTGPVRGSWCGGVVGRNYAYVHDNLFLYGTVGLAGLDANQTAVFANEAVVSNTNYAFETQTQALDKKGVWIKSGEAVAILNQIVPLNGWTTYYFIAPSANNGYPVLNGQAPEESATDLSQLQVDLSLVGQAAYAAGYNPTPTLKASIVVNGRTIELKSGVDFRVLADPDALGADGICKGTTAGDTPYQARIEGIGLYSGSPAASVAYGILKSDLSVCRLVVATAVYNGLPQNQPQVAVVDPDGVEVPADNYSLVINDGNDCVNVTSSTNYYTVLATADQDSNYTGILSGRYDILKANISTDCDLVGIYLEGHTVNGQPDSRSVWLFDDLQSKIYEVTPLFDPDSDLQWVRPQPGQDFNSPVFASDGSLLWQYCTAGEGIILVEGLESYQQEGERALLRATPKRLDPSGAPAYSDLEVAYSGREVLPEVIGVLFHGSLLPASQYDQHYYYYSDNTPRGLPLNTNATTSEEQPEASMTVRGNERGNIRNYLYIDFKIRPIAATSSQLAPYCKDDLKLFYAAGACPTPPKDSESGLPSNSSVDLRFYPDPNDPDYFVVVSADQWYFDFHHAVGPDGRQLGANDLGYLPGSKVTFAIHLIDNASLIWQDELLVEYTVVSASANIGDEDKVLLSDDVIEVIAPTVYDPAIKFSDWIDSFVLRNSVTGELLVRGTRATQGADFFVARLAGSILADQSLTIPSDALMPQLNPETGMIEGSFMIAAHADGGYLGTRTISYQCQRSLFPRQGEGIFISGTNKPAFLFGANFGTSYRTLPWTVDGWNAEQLSNRLLLGYQPNNISQWVRFEDFRVVAIYLDGRQVEAITEFDKDYTIVAHHVYDPESSLFAGDVDPDALYQFTTKLNKPQTLSSTVIQAGAVNGYYISRGVSLGVTEYMYTGFDLRDQVAAQLVFLDAHGNKMDPGYFEAVVIDAAYSGWGNIKDVRDYNQPRGGNQTYFDLQFTGDGIHFQRNVLTTNNADAVPSSRISREAQVALVPVNLRFSIVAADISDSEKVRIELDPVAQTVSFFDAQSGARLNYLQGANGVGDYLLSWGSYSPAQGYARVTTSGNGNLVASAASTAYQVIENQDGTWSLDIPYSIDAVSVDLGAVSWDYATRQAVPTDGVLALPAVAGSYGGSVIPAVAYSVRLGSWDGQSFNERLDGWAAGQTAYLYIESTNDLVCYGSKLLPLELVAPDPSKQFGQGFSGEVSVASTTFTALPATPAASISFDGTALVLGRDYQLSCQSVNAGTGSATISGLGEYTGSYSYSFTIQPADIAGIAGTVAPQPYSGQQLMPQATDISDLSFNGLALGSDDWALDADGYGANINVASGGSLTLLPGSSGNFTGSKQLAFAISPKPFADDIQVDPIASQAYSGLPLAVSGTSLSLTDTDSGQTLVYGQDFVISSYSNNRNVGLATVYLSGIGNYASSSVTADFSITPAALEPGMVQGVTASYEYQGGQLRPSPQLLLDGQPLPASDYQLEYGDNNSIGLGTGWVKATPIGNNLTGAAITLSFDISADISRAQIEAIPNSSYQPGGSYQPDLLLAFNGQELERGVHYTVQYDSYGAGAKTLTVTGIAAAAVYGSATESYAIDGRALTAAMITAPAAQDYTGHALQPQPLVKDGDTPLQLGLDYQLSYSNNTNVSLGSSRAVVSVHGIGNYAGLVSTNFDIDPKLLDASSFTAIAAAGLWPGSGSVAADLAIYDQSIIVDPDTNQSYRLVEGRDYTVSYQSNNMVGTATATVSGIGNYSFQWVEDFLVKGDIAAAQLTAIPQQAWTGTALEPALELRLGGQLLALGSDYQAAYSNNIDSGTALVTVSGLGLYQGSISTSFVIAPPLPSPGDDGGGNGNGGGNTGNGGGGSGGSGSGSGGGGGNTYNYYGSTSNAGTAATGSATAVTEPPKSNSSDNTASAGGNTAAPEATSPAAAPAPAPAPIPPLDAATAAGGLLPLPALIVAALLLIVILGALAHFYLRRRRLDNERCNRTM